MRSPTTSTRGWPKRRTSSAAEPVEPRGATSRPPRLKS
jgi:hypothetical protein